MITSMTGFGSGSSSGPSLDVTVEIKAVNGRFLNVAIKVPSHLVHRELEIDQLIRQELKRGSVSASVQVRFKDAAAVPSINIQAVRSYQKAFRALGLREDNIPMLPGVLDGDANHELSKKDWLAIVAATTEACAGVVATRQKEGHQLRAALVGYLDEMKEVHDQLVLRVPVVVHDYKEKLQQRLKVLIDDDMPVDPQLIARELAVFADRCDISEELLRLLTHIRHAHQLLETGAGVGRTLEFVSQELLREANTMGSKSADGLISKLIIQLKSTIEKFKEQVANIE